MNKSQNTILPRRFEAMMRQKIGDGPFEAFAGAMEQKPPVSIRVNPLKDGDLFADEEKVPWCRYGRYLKERPAFVWDPLYHAGAYYAQEASSMVFANAIDFTKDLKVLDLCAAPGGKSSLMLSFLSENSLLVSNEMVGKRAAILYENLVKWGSINTIVTQNRVSDFEAFRGYFDVVLIDAPCSGEGMFRKDREAIEQWNEGLVAHCSLVQKEILTYAVDLIKPGGLLIYSTCTFESAENEEKLQWLYLNFGHKLEPAEIPVQSSWGLAETQVAVAGGQIQKGYYCYPHLVRGEGQFISVMKVAGESTGRNKYKESGKNMRRPDKNEKDLLRKFSSPSQQNEILVRDEGLVFEIPSVLVQDAGFILDKLYVRKAGALLGRILRENFVPDHEMVMHGLGSPDIPRCALNRAEALEYMQRKTIVLPPGIPKGWVICTYEGVDIGLAKNLGNRVNNHYPAEWRIRKEPAPEYLY